eukprot:TRINITY_DN9623_c0_g1_i1.p1 TRINITY_DN9623_c0_g1~~TRINITY_DN9623_c0_g1_i1.p1  ORF type:complete len:230 (+),score=73.84 TRINITY_DN9623_c0_g1_i1:62-751(+)
MKKAKVDPEPSHDCSELQSIQAELEVIEEAFDAKVLELQAEFTKKKQPLFLKRNEGIAKIPKFWFQAFSNHRVLEMLLHENDSEIFEFVASLVVEEKDDVKSGFKISMGLKPNGFISDTELWKDITFTEDGQASITQSGVNWKEGKDPASSGAADMGKKREREAESFFSFFSTAEQDHVDVANILKDDLWPNPLKYYLGVGLDEDDSSFGGEGDEEEGDEDENEEGHEE